MSNSPTLLQSYLYSTFLSSESTYFVGKLRKTWYSTKILIHFLQKSPILYMPNSIQNLSAASQLNDTATSTTCLKLNFLCVCEGKPALTTRLFNIREEYKRIHSTATSQTSRFSVFFVRIRIPDPFSGGAVCVGQFYVLCPILSWEIFSDLPILFVLYGI